MQYNVPTTARICPACGTVYAHDLCPLCPVRRAVLATGDLVFGRATQRDDTGAK